MLHEVPRLGTYMVKDEYRDLALIDWENYMFVYECVETNIGYVEFTETLCLIPRLFLFFSDKQVDKALSKKISED